VNDVERLPTAIVAAEVDVLLTNLPSGEIADDELPEELTDERHRLIALMVGERVYAMSADFDTT
jgi:hypothetical protein